MGFKFITVLAVFGASVFGAQTSFAQSAEESPRQAVAQTCDVYDDFESVRCCKFGFIGEAFDCCRQHLADDQDPGTPEHPVSCEAPAPKPCDDVADPALKSCCEEYGGLTLDAVMECIPDQPDGQPQPVDPCQKNPALPECQTEARADPTGGSCVVTAAHSEDFVGSKLAAISAGGSGVALVIRAVDLVKGPAAYVELKQIEGPLVALEGAASWADAGVEKAKILNTKIGPFKEQPSWVAEMALPQSIVGKFIPDAKFVLSVYDVNAELIAETSCVQDAYIHAKGGASGCSLIRD